MSRILITGANGFVGSALADELVKRNCPIRLAVRMGKEPSNRRRFPNAEREQISVDELGPGTDWLVALQQVSCVVHLAARVHIMKDFAADPYAEYQRINSAGTERLARCAAQAGVKRLVFMSTIKVNGEETNATPFAETDPARPRDPYAMSKWEAELSLIRVARETGLEIVIVRPPLMYGPGVKGNFLRLLKLVARHVPMPFAGVDNLRSFLYVGNAVDALILAATHPAAAGNIYLLSDGQDLSTPVLLRKLAASLGAPARLVYCPPVLLRFAGRVLGKTELLSRLTGSLQVDSTVVRRQLQWNPPYSVEQGLEATAKWYRNEY